MDFGGKVVVVTGATGFLGSDVCKVFLEANARVVGVYGFAKELPYFRRTLGKRAVEVLLEKADVAREGAMDRVVARVLRRFRRVDALVATVGGYMSGTVAETRADALDWAVDLNLKSAFLAARAVIPAMRKARRGKIVFVSTRTALRGEAEAFLYSATKSGVNRLVEALADELRVASVQVNCVMPSVMDTPANRSWMSRAQISRAVKTSDVGRVIRWLCSEEADPISGAALPVYGRS